MNLLILFVGIAIVFLNHTDYINYDYEQSTSEIVFKDLVGFIFIFYSLFKIFQLWITN